MKEAIYIGPPCEELGYGVTGTVTYATSGLWNFIPDGSLKLYYVTRESWYNQNDYDDLRSKSCRLTVAT